MSECGYKPEDLSAYLDAELSADERKRLHEHVAVCPKCRGLLEELSRVASAVRDLPEMPAPQLLSERISIAIHDEVRQSHQTSHSTGRRPGISRWVLGTAAVAGLAAAGLIGAIAYHQWFAASKTNDLPPTVATQDGKDRELAFAEDKKLDALKAQSDTMVRDRATGKLIDSENKEGQTEVVKLQVPPSLANTDETTFYGVGGGTAPGATPQANIHVTAVNTLTIHTSDVGAAMATINAMAVAPQEGAILEKSAEFRKMKEGGLAERTDRNGNSFIQNTPTEAVVVMEEGQARACQEKLNQQYGGKISWAEVEGPEEVKRLQIAGNLAQIVQQQDADSAGPGRKEGQAPGSRSSAVEVAKGVQKKMDTPQDGEGKKSEKDIQKEGALADTYKPVEHDLPPPTVPHDEKLKGEVERPTADPVKTPPPVAGAAPAVPTNIEPGLPRQTGPPAPGGEGQAEEAQTANEKKPQDSEETNKPEAKKPGEVGAGAPAAPAAPTADELTDKARLKDAPKKAEAPKAEALDGSLREPVADHPKQLEENEQAPAPIVRETQAPPLAEQTELYRRQATPTDQKAPRYVIWKVRLVQDVEPAQAR